VHQGCVFFTSICFCLDGLLLVLFHLNSLQLWFDCTNSALEIETGDLGMLIKIGRLHIRSSNKFHVTKPE
jgi:hypothetical protein